jgi:CHASE2 domain-containing sensor protein
VLWLWTRYVSGFGKPYLRALPWIIIFTLAVQALEHWGAFAGFEMVGLDTILRLAPRQISQDIFIVEISDTDYKNLFRATSPLEPPKIVALVRSILSANPAVVGVDLDTSDDIWCGQDVVGMLPGDAKSGVVIWAQVPAEPDNSAPGEAEPYELRPVLGGKLIDERAMGIPGFPYDLDGYVRRYRGEFPVTGEPNQCPGTPPAQGGRAVVRSRRTSMKSLSRVIAETYKPALARQRTAERIFNFAGDRYHFQINDAHDFVGARGESVELNDLQKRQLVGKIVLIGGSFRAARDYYRTPLGTMTGVELIAQAVESDLKGGGIRELNTWLERLADILAGSLITWFYFYWERRPRTAFRMSLLGIPLLSLFASFLAYRSYAYWFNFAPIVIGMLIHQLYEQSKLGARFQALTTKASREIR